MKSPMVAGALPAWIVLVHRGDMQAKKRGHRSAPKIHSTWFFDQKLCV